MDNDSAAEKARVRFAAYFVLLVEMAVRIPAAQSVSDAAAAARLDVAAAKLLVEESPSVPELVRQVLSVEPASAYAYTVWGLALTKRAEFDRALIAFDIAVDLDARFLLAICAKIALLTRTGDAPDSVFAPEIALLRRQLWLANDAAAKPFMSLLGTPMPVDTTRYVNIGGGPNFEFPYWRNLEAVPGPGNPEPFHLTPECDFPLEDASLELVYTSHCLEHLDDATVARILAESRRILRPDGALLVKIPDFDRLLADWRANDPALIGAPIWDIESMLTMWAARGVADTLDNRAAVIFSGFWNDEYGDDDSHFSGRGQRGPDAYFGPPVLRQETLRALIENSTPHEIAAALRRRIVECEPSYHFSHQNAWSKREMTELLSVHGFKTLSFDRAKIVPRYRWIPRIDDMNAMSMYYLAVPQGGA